MGEGERGRTFRRRLDFLVRRPGLSLNEINAGQNVKNRIFMTAFEFVARTKKWLRP